MGQPVIRFGVFEVDLQAGELRKQGLRVNLQEKPLQVLAILLERPSKVVTREELQQRLWPDVNVDFEHSLSTAIKKLRDALDDAADNPRFIETRPGRGYRFICPIEGLERRRWHQIRARQAWLAAIAVVVLVAGLVSLNVGGLRDRLLGRPAPGEITSIAVLPLENLSGDPEQEYFSDGMTETLITELSKIRTLKVISRQSVMQFKGTDKPLPEIARALKVDAVVKGSALHIGERVRITVQLIEAASDRNVWADSYDRELSDVLALQSDVARAIAAEIRITLTPDEEARLASHRSVNPDAYRLYLVGRFYWNKRTEEGFNNAIDHFQRAIGIDPTYAPAYSGIADSYLMLGRWDFMPKREVLPRAKAAAQKALEIDESLAEAHTSLGLYHQTVWNWAACEKELKRALELSPSYASANHWYGDTLSMIGRHNEAILWSQRALELDPLSPMINTTLARAFYLARQYDRCIAQGQNTVRLFPEFVASYWVLGGCYVEKGMPGEAIAVFEKARSLLGARPEEVAAMKQASARDGLRGYYLWLLEDLKEESKRKYVSPWLFAMTYGQLNQKEQALAWLEKAYEERNYGMTSLKVDPIYDPLRDDPRFQSLLRRMNFPE